MSDNHLHAASSVRRLPPAEDSSDRIPPPSPTTVDAEVVSAEVVESMPVSGVRQKLDAVKSRFEQAAAIVQNDVKPRVEQAIQLLVEIDYQQGWEELGSESIRQLIQAELQPLLNMSVSQTYRRLNAAKVRQQVSHLCDNVEDIPDSQMEALSKLPSFAVARGVD